MKRVGIFVDISNLYHTISRRYGGRKLDYGKLYDFIGDFGDVMQAIAYGSQAKGPATRFITALKEVGFSPKYREERSFNWNVGIAMDIVNMADRLDMVVLCSANGALEPVVTWCRSKGIDVVVFGCGIANALTEEATESIEIPESLLEESRKYETPAPAKPQLPPLLDSDVDGPDSSGDN